MKRTLKLIPFIFLACLITVSCSEDSEINPVENASIEFENDFSWNIPPSDCTIGHRTQTPGGWGAKPKGNNAGSYLYDNFPDVASGLKVGCEDGFTVRLEGVEAITDFLPSGGQPAVLTMNYINPKKNELKNSLAGHLVALYISLLFDANIPDYSESIYPLYDLVINQGPFIDCSVGQVFVIANDVLGGCSTEHTPSEMVDVLSNINENFVDGTANNGFLSCPDPL